MKCQIIGAPVEEGASQPGCIMGPDAFRTAGLIHVLADLGHEVEDLGNVSRAPDSSLRHSNPALRNLPQIAGWSDALQTAAYDAAKASDLPIFLGGDHSMSIGTVAGVAHHSSDMGQPQFVLWLDAHPDLHTLDSTTSGNLHGTPMAYLMGLTGFEDIYPPLPSRIDPANACFIGLRSVDAAEKARISDLGIEVYDMRQIDEIGAKAALETFLARVSAANGRLHVSLDVDFLDPGVAPAVGTTVPGGATFREAHLIMEMLHESGLVTSLDMVELNPFLDERGRTAQLMVDLCGSLMGRKVLDRPTTRF